MSIFTLNRAWLALGLALPLATTAGCTLIADASRHQGGAGIDAGPVDADRRDVGTEDVGTEDASRDAAPTDAPVDAARGDAGPPECATDAECLSGVAACVEGRCTLCVPMTPTRLDVHADPNLGDDLELVIGQEGASREIVLGWRGMGTRIYLHRTSMVAPASPGTFTSVTDAIASLGGLTGVSEISDVALGAGQYEASAGRIDVAVVGRVGATETFLAACTYTNSTTTPISSDTFPDPERRATPDAMLARAVIEGGSIVSRSRAGAAVSVEIRDLAYLNVSDSTAFGVPGGDPAPIETGSGVTLMTDPTNFAQLFTWFSGSSSAGTVATPDRTGDPSWVQNGGTNFLVAYPAGSEIQLRQFDCGGTCMPSASVRADIRTGASEIGWVRITSSGGAYMVLSAEHVGAVWQLVLRSFRADLRALTAPGGGFALVLDEAPAPGAFPVGRITRGTDPGGAVRLVASWINSPTSGDRTLRLVSLPLACE